MDWVLSICSKLRWKIGRAGRLEREEESGEQGRWGKERMGRKRRHCNLKGMSLEGNLNISISVSIYL